MTVLLKCFYWLYLSQVESAPVIFERVVQTRGDVTFVDASTVFLEIISFFTGNFSYEELTVEFKREFNFFGVTTHDQCIALILGVFG